MGRFAKIVLVIAAAACLAAAGFGIAAADRYLAGPQAVRNVLLFLVLPACGAGAALLALRLKREARIAIALSLTAAVAGAYGAEAFLAWRIAGLPEAASARLGLTYDGRGMRRVVDDLGRDGIRAVPALWPGRLLQAQPDGTARSSLSVNGREILPLGGVADVMTVMCREVGSYVTYRADRHGFNNPDAAWDGPVDLMLIGDSFAQGQCVAPDAQMAALLRDRLPGTLSLGMGHNGPFLELAALKEYGPALKPRIVLWLYYQGNDLTEDLFRERASPLLMRYLDAGFSQGLAARQAEIDGQLSTYLQGPSIERDQSRNRLLDGLVSTAKLRNLRRAMGASYQGPPPDVALFQRILDEARATVAGWGGTLYFVYLPGWPELARPSAADQTLRTQVIEAARAAGLDIIDLHAAMTASSDPPGFFFYPGSHYNPAGQAAVAEAILGALGPQAASAPRK